MSNESVSSIEPSIFSMMARQLEDNKVKDNIKDFSDSLNLNYVGSIKQNIQSLKELHNQINMVEGPGKLIIPNVVENFLKHFKNYLFSIKLLIFFLFIFTIILFIFKIL